MENNTLKAIQTLSKVGKIISKIIFICCVVGFCFCIAGIIGLACGLDGIEIGDVTLESIVQSETEVTKGTMYTAMAIGAIFCAGEAVLCKFSEHYFTRELADGTPFTFGGAKELMRLGVLAICIPIGVQIIASIVRSILEHVLEGVELTDMGSIGSVSIGIMMIVMALICRYGAEREADHIA